jgi:ATP-binding cassette, subfamily G (WHITE), member 2
LEYFDRLGFPCPPMTNPADHLINVLAIGSEIDSKSQQLPDNEYGALASIGEAEEGNSGIELKSITTEAVIQWEPMNIIVDLNSIEKDMSPIESPKKQQPWIVQFFILFRRSMHSHIRRWDIIVVNLIVTLIVAVFTASSVWKDIGTHKDSSSRRQPALFFCVIHQGIVASLQGTHSFPLERALMLRERAGGTYYISAYFLAKTFADFTVQVFSPILFSIFVYPNIGFAPTVKQFFIFMGFMILDSNAATSLTNAISCLCVSIEMSTVVAAFTYEICRLYGGWFISPALIKDYSDWTFADVLSYIKYAFVAVSLNENRDLLITCLPRELSPPQTGSCKIPPLTAAPFDGANYNAYYGYNRYTISACAGYLIAYIICCKVLAYIGLKYIKI